MLYRLRVLFLIVILAFLLLPALQQRYQWVEVPELKGAIVKKEEPAFSLSSWFDNSFQVQAENFLNEDFGFRNILVRLNHQVDFSCFKNARAAFVVVGKNNYLYEKAYIDALYGRDFMGDSLINNYVSKIRKAQDSMAKKGKLFLYVFAPGKAAFFPEYIPDHLKSAKTATNYECMLAAMKKAGVNHIDFNGFFPLKKETSPFPLYPQFGIHWSNYGASVAYDSIISYLRFKTKYNLACSNFEYQSRDTLVPPDNDLISGMNLLWQPKTYPMVFPVSHFSYDSTKNKKLNMITVADSYWWSIYGNDWHRGAFSTSDFWYYNKEVFPDLATNPAATMNNINYFKRMEKADVIIILNTVATLPQLNYGFADMCYEVFCTKRDSVKEALASIRETIINDPKWLSSIKEKAITRGLALDTMIRNDALWHYNEHHSKKY